MRYSQEAFISIDKADIRKAEEYLKEKYSDDKFSPESMITPSIDIPYVEYFFTNEKYEGKHIRVIQTADDEFSDDYYGIIRLGEYTGMLESIIKESISDAKVFVRYAGRGFPAALNDKTPLDAALKMEDNLFYSFVSVFSADSSAAEKTDEICSSLGKAGLPNSISVYIIDQEIYSELTSDNYTDIISEKKLVPAAIGEAVV